MIIDFSQKRGAIRQVRWTIALLDLAKACPGRTRFLDNILYFENTPGNRAYLTATFPEAKFVGVASPARRTEAQSSILRPQFATNHTPDPSQEEALRLAWRNPSRFAFFEKPGWGKTKAILDHVVRLWCEGIIDRCLVVTLSMVHEQWVLDEIPKHVHSSIPIDARIFRPNKRPPRSFFAADGENKLKILAMNYESYNASRGSSQVLSFVVPGRTAIVLDESHVIKGPSSLTSLALYRDQGMYASRIIATGEPTPLGLQDYYAQMRFLGQDVLGVPNYTSFKSKYCRMGGFRNNAIIGYMNTDDLHYRISKIAHVAEPDIKAEQIFYDEKFSITAEARKLYEEMKADLLIQIDDGRIASARTALAGLIRLQQIACGRLHFEDGSHETFDKTRIKFLENILKRYEGEKCIIWNAWRADIELQRELLGNSAVCINGDTPQSDRLEMVKQFLHIDGPKYLVASTPVCNAGLNLQGHCRLNIYYSNNDNWGQRNQSELRTYRRGATGRIIYGDIMARGTVDVSIRRRHRDKRLVALLSAQQLRDLITDQNE